MSSCISSFLQQVSDKVKAHHCQQLCAWHPFGPDMHHHEQHREHTAHAAAHPVVYNTGAPPPLQPCCDTTYTCRPPGCRRLTASLRVWHRVQGPNHSPGRILQPGSNCHRKQTHRQKADQCSCTSWHRGTGRSSRRSGSGQEAAQHSRTVWYELKLPPACQCECCSHGRPCFTACSPEASTAAQCAGESSASATPPS